MGNECGAHTFPYIEAKNKTAQIEHEATTSKIGEDQIFYCNQRGIDTCLLYTSPSPRDATLSRMPSSA